MRCATDPLKRNTIDVCVYNAGYYKRLAKAAFILSLLLGTAIIVLSVFKAHSNGNKELLACFVRNSKAANDGNCTACSACNPDLEQFDGGINGMFVLTQTGIFMTASLLTMVCRSPTATYK